MFYAFYILSKDLNQKFTIFASTIIGIMAAIFWQIMVLLISGAMNFNVLLATLIPSYLFVPIIEGFSNINNYYCNWKNKTWNNGNG